MQPSCVTLPQEPMHSGLITSCSLLNYVRKLASGCAYDGDNIFKRLTLSFALALG